MGLSGAAITASLAYSASLIYQITVFLDRTRSSMRDLLPNKLDMVRARALWKNLRP